MQALASILFVSLLSATDLALAQHGSQPQPDPAAASPQSAAPSAGDVGNSSRGINAPQPGTQPANNMESSGASGTSGTSGSSGSSMSGGNAQSGSGAQEEVMTDRGISRNWSGLGSTGGGTGTGTSSGTTASDPGAPGDSSGASGATSTK